MRFTGVNIKHTLDPFNHSHRRQTALEIFSSRRFLSQFCIGCTFHCHCRRFAQTCAGSINRPRTKLTDRVCLCWWIIIALTMCCAAPSKYFASRCCLDMFVWFKTSCVRPEIICCCCHLHAEFLNIYTHTQRSLMNDSITNLYEPGCRVSPRECLNREASATGAANMASADDDDAAVAAAVAVVMLCTSFIHSFACADKSFGLVASLSTSRSTFNIQR